MNALPLEQLLNDIKPFFDNGEFFRAYDLAITGLEQFPREWRFAHRAVLSLANAGAIDMAIAKFQDFELDKSDLLDVRSLLARLRKDQAFAESGARRVKLFRESRAIYESTFRASQSEPDAYYPAINAAATALLAGDKDDAIRLAREALAVVLRNMAARSKNSAPDYWLLATAIEAHLILGQIDAARLLFEPAIAAAGENFAQLSTTARQLERICVANGTDLGAVVLFEPPLIVHYLGHIISANGRLRTNEESRIAGEIAHTLDGIKVGAAYGSLAAGADILFAEALIKRNIALNVILPFRDDEFIQYSVKTAGESWVARFEACRKAAQTVRYATEDSYLDDDHLFTYASKLGMGLAVLRARHMHARLQQIAVWDGKVQSGVAGTVVDMQMWAKAGHPQTIIRCGGDWPDDKLDDFVMPRVRRGRRETSAMLFADIHGFSKLTDVQLPIFVKQIMGRIARVFRRFDKDVEFVNTWGDGVFAVFKNAGKAAQCALDLQKALSGVDLESHGLPKDLLPRVGGHLGPVYRLREPVSRRTTSFGAHVNRAARIEPITPVGCVYVTETFAAVLALHHATEFSCDYVGYAETAKNYGRMRLFLLRPARLTDGPSVMTNFEVSPVGRH